MNKPGQPRRILLIEDDEDDYILFSSVAAEIRSFPVEIAWVDTCRAALEKVGRNTFDLFFVDYRLPGCTGLDLLHQFRQRGLQQPFILLTGQGDHAVDLQAMEEGASDYLEKDLLSPPLLERIIRYAISRAHTLNALRRSEKTLRILSQKLIQAQENERTRIAQELHDSTSANLTAIKYAIEKKLYEADYDPDSPDTAYLKHVIGLIQETMGDIQRLHSDLRPTVLDDLGLLAAVRRLCRQFEEIHQDFQVSQEITVAEEAVPAHLKIVVYRILQEALNNIARHSGADQVHIAMVPSDDKGLRLFIADNGRGFDVDASLEAETENRVGGFGLMNMRERAVFTGGNINIRSALRQGTTVDIVWPNRFLTEEGEA